MNAWPRHRAVRILLVLAGFMAWAPFAVLPALSGRGFAEAWDMRAYWTIGLPALALLHAIAGYATGVSLRRLPLFALAGHAAGMVLLHRAGTDAGLVPLAALLICLPLYGVLLAAAWLGRQAAEFRAPA